MLALTVKSLTSSNLRCEFKYTLVLARGLPPIENTNCPARSNLCSTTSNGTISAHLESIGIVFTGSDNNSPNSFCLETKWRRHIFLPALVPSMLVQDRDIFTWNKQTHIHTSSVLQWSTIHPWRGADVQYPRTCYQLDKQYARLQWVNKKINFTYQANK